MTEKSFSHSNNNAIDINIDGKKFGDKTVLGPIKLTLRKSSFTVITGPSGVGKTTLLKIIAGLDPTIAPPAKYLSVGFAFQEPRLLPWRSVGDNLALVSKQTTNNAELLDEMGLSEAIDLFPGQISLGMARRVSLARAFIINPDFLLLDEPLVSLDETTATRLREWLLTFWKKRKPTVLMVTHHLREALQLADNIVVINGNPATVLEHHHYDTPHHERNDEWIRQHLQELEASLKQHNESYY